MNKLKTYFNKLKNSYKENKLSYNLYIIGMLFIFFGNLQMMFLGFFVVIISFAIKETFSIAMFLLFLLNVYVSIKIIHFEKSLIESVQKIQPTREDDHFVFIYEDDNMLKVEEKDNLPTCEKFYYIKEIHPYKKLFLEHNFVSKYISCKNPLKE